jgi:hypothetical protein
MARRLIPTRPENPLPANGRIHGNPKNHDLSGPCPGLDDHAGLWRLRGAERAEPRRASDGAVMLQAGNIRSCKSFATERTFP